MKYSSAVIGLYVSGLLGCADPTSVPTPSTTPRRTTSARKSPVVVPKLKAASTFYPVVTLPPTKQVETASPVVKKLLQRFHLQMGCGDYGAMGRSKLATGKFGKHVLIDLDTRHSWSRGRPSRSNSQTRGGERLLRQLGPSKGKDVSVLAIGCDGKPEDAERALEPGCDLTVGPELPSCQQDSLVGLMVSGQLYTVASIENRFYFRRADGKGRAQRHEVPGIERADFLAVNRTQTPNRVLVLESSAGASLRLSQLFLEDGQVVIERIADDQISNVVTSDFHTPECNEHGDCLIKLVNAEGALKWVLRVASGDEYEWQSSCTPLIRERPAEYAKALPKTKDDILKALVKEQCCRRNVSCKATRLQLKR